jgi:hypothetical protein
MLTFISDKSHIVSEGTRGDINETKAYKNAKATWIVLFPEIKDRDLSP